jgi:hypothetical protein
LKTCVQHFRLVARASRPSNPASRRISSGAIHCWFIAGTKASSRPTTVSSGTPETTGQRPVPPVGF